MIFGKRVKHFVDPKNKGSITLEKFSQLMDASDFLRELPLPDVPGENSGAVDLDEDDGIDSGIKTKEEI